MRNNIVAAILTLGSILGVAGQANASDFYAVIENDFKVINQNTPDFAVSTAGMGWSNFVGDDSYLSVELSTGAAYSADDADHVVKAEATYATFLGEDVMVEVSLSDTYFTGTGSGSNLLEGDTKIRIGL